MLDYRRNIDENKNLLNYCECKILINKHNFDKIGSGRQGEIFKAVSDNCGSVIIKKSGKTTYDVKRNKRQLRKLIWENKFLLKIKRLIDNNVCPNFIKIIDFIPEKGYLILEYADGDCSKLFRNKFKFNLLWSFLCQSLIGLLCLHKILRIFHRDFHFGNILYKKINENVILCYTINEKKYYIPTFGYLFMISDFGQSIEIDYIEKTEKYQNVDFNADTKILALTFDETIVKFISKKHDNNFANFKNIFTFENQEIIQKLMNDGVTITDVIASYDYLKKLSFPIFNNSELIKNGLNEESIELKNILKNNISTMELINKIYDKYNVKDNKYDKNFIVSFTINL